MTTLDRFTTDRLFAERLRVEDFQELCAMHADPRVMATLGGVRSDAETARFLSEKLAHWDRYGFGHWMFRDRVSGAFVGRGGIQHIDVDGRPEIEIGYSVLVDFWGRGLATEMAVAMVDIALDLLDLAEIVCFTLTDNPASQRVMQKAGFIYERTFCHGGHPHVLYRLTLEQYTALRT